LQHKFTITLKKPSSWLLFYRTTMILIRELFFFYFL
jgi:hypothetical protein